MGGYLNMSLWKKRTQSKHSVEPIRGLGPNRQPLGAPPESASGNP